MDSENGRKENATCVTAVFHPQLIFNFCL